MAETSNRARWALVAVAVVLVLVPVAWWLFGWRVYDNPALGVIKHRRYFARYTRIEADSNRDGAVDFIAFYRWSAPYVGTVNGLCGDSHTALWEDRNFDGAWDTWVTRADSDPENRCLSKWSADLDGDGEADWEQVAPYAQSAEVYEQLVVVRGF